LERWYRPDGDLDRDGLVKRIHRFVLSGVT